MIAFLIVVPVILIIFMVVMTVYVIKNINPKNEEQIDSFASEKQKWEHIKDFSNINSKDNNKINAFGSGFEDEVQTLGVEFSSNIKNSEKDSVEANNFFNQNENLKNASANDFVNDYMTMSINSQNDFDVSDEIDNDETVDMFQVQNRIKSPPEIEVTLRYKDGNYNKMMKMKTSQITVGRGIGNDLVFKSECYASKNHGIFTIRNGKLYLKDLNSKNGTYINRSKERIEGEIMLEKSCDITFGDVTVNVSIVYR